MSVNFYHTANNPRDLSSTVGGAISSTGYTGYLSELFVYVDSPPSGSQSALNQYRKLHIKNDDNVTYTGVKVWLYGIEHPDQVSIGLEASASQTISSATGSPPTSVTFSAPTDYINGLDVGSLAPGQSTGIWLKVTLSGITDPDKYATFSVTVGFYDI
ncbi:MAG: hypothetical protein D6698_14205 [Gammaproteobacteria bacterium]|nr:MAG: hypothetical protein D6698_14205 [Gammaproteobacteria bacterium]